MSKKSEVQRFLYTECDFFPVQMKPYLGFLSKVDESIFCAGKIIRKDLKSPKTPSGYLCMSPLYFYNDKNKIGLLTEDLIKNRLRYTQQGYAFEGMVCESFRNVGFEVFTTSNYFISNYEFYKNLDPVTWTTHQHNPLNLSVLLGKYGIDKGKHIKGILESSHIIQSYDSLVLKRELSKGDTISFQEVKLQ